MTILSKTPTKVNVLFILDSKTQEEMLSHVSENPTYDAPDSFSAHPHKNEYHLCGNINPYKKISGIFFKHLSENGFVNWDLKNLGTITVAVHYKTERTVSFGFQSIQNPTRFFLARINKETGVVAGGNVLLESFLRHEKKLEGAVTHFTQRSDALLIVSDIYEIAGRSRFKYLLEEALVLSHEAIRVDTNILIEHFRFELLKKSDGITRNKKKTTEFV